MLKSGNVFGGYDSNLQFYTYVMIQGTTMKKHAILMTAYCHPHLINRMLDEYSPHFDFYIHIDKKSALSADALHLSDNVTVIKELNVNWGGVNHLRAFLRLMELARETGYDYYHLITGQDCIVARPEEFDVLMGDKSHLSFNVAADVWSEAEVDDRYNRYRFIDIFNLKNPLYFRWERRLLKVQKKIGIRQKRTQEPLYAGNTYCSLTHEAASYILDQGRKLYKRVRYTLIPEEVYFQTLLVNSPLRDKLDSNCLRLIIWPKNTGGSPKTLDESDWSELTSGKYLFGRKIDPVQSASLIKMLDDKMV